MAEPRDHEKGPLNAERFEIVVKGRLSPTLIAAIDGFEVSRCDQGRPTWSDGCRIRPRLHSTLELLRDLNIELVSVNPKPPEPENLRPDRSVPERRTR